MKTGEWRIVDLDGEEMEADFWSKEDADEAIEDRYNPEDCVHAEEVEYDEEEMDADDVETCDRKGMFDEYDEEED